jgi:hypothetical protein
MLNKPKVYRNFENLLDFFPILPKLAGGLQKRLLEPLFHKCSTDPLPNHIAAPCGRCDFPYIFVDWR